MWVEVENFKNKSTCYAKLNFFMYTENLSIKTENYKSLKMREKKIMSATLFIIARYSKEKKVSCRRSWKQSKLSN